MLKLEIPKLKLSKSRDKELGEIAKKVLRVPKLEVKKLGKSVIKVRRSEIGGPEKVVIGIGR